MSLRWGLLKNLKSLCSCSETGNISRSRRMWRFQDRQKRGEIDSRFVALPRGALRDHVLESYLHLTDMFVPPGHSEQEQNVAPSAVSGVVHTIFHPLDFDRRMSHQLVHNQPCVRGCLGREQRTVNVADGPTISYRAG